MSFMHKVEPMKNRVELIKTGLSDFYLFNRKHKEIKDLEKAASGI